MAEKNLETVRERITRAAEQFGRDPDSISLIAISKTKSMEAILAAYDAGQRRFGESYVQEAVNKIALIDKPDIEWHFVGPIQSNKTKLIAENFDWVHSIDRSKIAKRLSEQRPPGRSKLNVCLQVNISGEASKSGVTFDDLEELAEQVYSLPGIQMRGLMAIPQRETTFEAQRSAFARMAEAMYKLNEKFNWHLDVLSMGMSQDMEAAISAGATMVRVGTDIFGERD